MPTPHLLILSSGGLRSLVATALVLQPGEKLRATLLHVLDGRDNARLRAEFVRRQAEAFGITRVAEISLPHLHAGSTELDGRPGPTNSTLAEPQLLLVALAHARHHHADRIIWPCSFNGELRRMARATEQAQLCGHLAELDQAPVGTAPAPATARPVIPGIDTPLLEYTDRQVLELGTQLNVSWRLAWSCYGFGETPCRNCPPCRRRAAAFHAAGLLDPAAMPQSARAR